MINVMLGQCVDAEPALTRIASQPWTVKTAYHLSKLLRAVRSETKLFEERRIALVKSLGEERDPSKEETAQGVTEKVIMVKPQHFKSYLDQIKELREIPVSLAENGIDLDALNGDSKVSGVDLLDIAAFLVEPSSNGNGHA